MLSSILLTFVPKENSRSFGSGFNVHTAKALLMYADGAIVGTSVKRDAVVSDPVDEERVRELRDEMGA